MALMWVCTVVSSITIVLRFVFRARKAIIGWDDLFMLVALVCPPLIPPSLSPPWIFAEFRARSCASTDGPSPSRSSV